MFRIHHVFVPSRDEAEDFFKIFLGPAAFIFEIHRHLIPRLIYYRGRPHYSSILSSIVFQGIMPPVQKLLPHLRRHAFLEHVGRSRFHGRPVDNVLGKQYVASVHHMLKIFVKI